MTSLSKQLDDYFNKVKGPKETYKNYNFKKIGWTVWKETEGYMVLSYAASTVKNSKEFEVHASVLAKTLNLKASNFENSIIGVYRYPTSLYLLVIAKDYKSLESGMKSGYSLLVENVI